MAVVTICNDFEAPHPPKKIKSATASTVSPSIWQNAGVVSCSLLQDIFPTQGSNPCLPHCRWILYQLSQHFGSPKILEWVAYPFSRGSSWPRNRTWVSCIAGRFFTSRATMEASSSVIVCLFFFFFLSKCIPFGDRSSFNYFAVTNLYLTNMYFLSFLFPATSICHLVISYRHLRISMFTSIHLTFLISCPLMPTKIYPLLWVFALPHITLYIQEYSYMC